MPRVGCRGKAPGQGVRRRSPLKLKAVLKLKVSDIALRIRLFYLLCLQIYRPLHAYLLMQITGDKVNSL